ncbi:MULTISPECIES: YheV family putative zinc ribbon protein [unclassified Arsenophonus]|uniref:YheV family putative zinc ribbon protein n=1 Tax=unclassified Arsenophonus TaxID=2627083 RepID=UPI00285BD900|nr:YheV family putative zinc ribbon protein [Arsenophonus sp.]MDR5610333.1 YheV family putative zinc ribbon protein [Arsenophonus sp.]MDR5614164.1 YheV family putative zinc ribbon protein [Arsenophonus sp.]
MSVIRKRFIAGAVCPKCQSQDTLMVWQKNAFDYLECKKCHYRQSQTVDGSDSHIKDKNLQIEIFTLK